MKNFMVYTIIIIFGSLLSSCKKFVGVDNPPDQVISSDLFSTDEGATAAIAGLYSRIMNETYFFANGGITVCGGLSADELYSRITSADEMHFYQNALLPSDEFILNSRLWTAAYKGIYQLNAILEGLERSTVLTPSLKAQLQGEARFLRAFHYFYLVNLFGPVPLVTVTSYTANTNSPRAEPQKIYAQIIEDLNKAKDLMTDSYPSPEKLRPNKWAAMALLARAYLYIGNWAGAEEAATMLINSNNYSLERDLDKVFTPSSSEIIWQLLPVSGSKTPVEAQAFLPPPSASGRPLYPLVAPLYNSFDTADARKKTWTQAKTVSGVLFAFPYKYKIKTPVSAPQEYNVVLRFAEQFLIRAEARTQLADFPGARSDIDTIRFRAGLPATTATDRATLLAALENENKFEFVAEWGHRWFDLKRWGRANLVLSPLKAPNWQASDTLYPVPLTEIKRNPALTQNPGYQ